MAKYHHHQSPSKTINKKLMLLHDLDNYRQRHKDKYIFILITKKNLLIFAKVLGIIVAIVQLYLMSVLKKY